MRRSRRISRGYLELPGEFAYCLAMVKWVVLSIAASACGFQRPADVDVPDDAGDHTQLTIRVSSAGNDVNDGIATPVLTLKRALAIAAVRSETVTIVMDAGRYDMSGGETFPYTLPTNVTIAGAASGGTVLAGNSTTPGLIVDAGALQDLELENFTIAITAKGMARLARIHVRTSDVAVQAETEAAATVSSLDIAGTQGACSVGILLNGAAMLAANDVSTHDLGTTLRAKDNSTTKLTAAHLTADDSCLASILHISSGGTFTLGDSTLDHGTSGVTFQGAQSPTQATLTNVTIKNMSSDAINGDTATVRMTGGEVSSSGASGVMASGGTWTFNGVSFSNNNASGVHVQNASLTMRGCNLSANGNGVRAMSAVKVDLGTEQSACNNTLRNRIVGFILDKGSQLSTAVANTWQPGVQGTDTTGKYDAVMIVAGPIPVMPGNNYTILDSSSLLR